jgi:cytochrome b
MHTAPTLPRAESTAPSTRPQRRVVDAPTRMFHALFALSFLGAYLTADTERWRALHVSLGYTLAGLLVFRVLYGLFGPRHVRLGLLLRKLLGGPAWARGVVQQLRAGHADGIGWTQGQNLAMALAVLALLVLALPLTFSGWATYTEWGAEWGGRFGSELFEELHEFFGNAFLAMVLAHIGLVAALSLLRRRNQAWPMVTGQVPGAGPDLVKRNHAWLAALLLLAVLVVNAWQWQVAALG